jgi:phospholipid-binding lipoprotein MlaA
MMIKSLLSFIALSTTLFASHLANIPQGGGPENVVASDIDPANEWLFEGLETKQQQDQVDNDPLELMNRAIYSFNKTFVDGLVLKPISVLYRDTVHEDAKKGIENFVNNTMMPLQVVNFALQADGTRALHGILRFILNTTVGLFGLLDPATELGFPNYDTSFNETLTSWGVETGPYLMIPFLGPSSFRGAAGYGGDWLVNPVRYYVNDRHHRYNRHGQQVYIFWALYGIYIVKERAKLIDMVNDIDKTSKDPYVSIRNYYFQQQEKVKKRVEERRKDNAAERA